jgi:hypothetical protein
MKYCGDAFVMVLEIHACQSEWLIGFGASLHNQ